MTKEFRPWNIWSNYHDHVENDKKNSPVKWIIQLKKVISFLEAFYYDLLRSNFGVSGLLGWNSQLSFLYQYEAFICNLKPKAFNYWRMKSLRGQGYGKPLSHLSINLPDKNKKKTRESKKRNVFNEPLNNGDIFNFQNLISFWLSTPKLRFWYINIPFLFTISRDILNQKLWFGNPQKQGVSLGMKKDKSQPVIYHPLMDMLWKTVPTVPARLRSLYSLM